MTSRSPIIGIRDSGVGGLTVARQIRQVLPQVPLLYFADIANMPYGNRSPDEIRHFAFSITQFLREQGADMVIFACNTTSAYALDAARSHFNFPLLGMIEGGVEAALNLLPPSEQDLTIGVLATSATVQSGVYSKQLRNRFPTIHCIEIECPLFVPLVESEQIYSDAAFEACRHALAPLLDANVDAVILGCTHFPLLLPTLQKIAPGLRFIDPAQSVAKETAHLFESTFLPVQDQITPKDTYYSSGDSVVLKHWINKMMPSSFPSQIHPAPIFRLS